MKKFLILLVMFIFALPVFAQNDADKVLKSELGKVQSVEYEDVEQSFTDKSQVKQIVTIKLLTGEFKGQEFKTMNMITNNPYYDIFLKKGDKVILHSEMEEDGETINYDIADIHRINFVYVLTAIFVGLLLIVGRRKGFNSLLSIVITVALILFMMAPMVRSGFNPIVSALIISLLSTLLTMYTVGGFNHKSTSASIGVIGSLIFASFLSITLCKYGGGKGISAS